MIDTIKKVAAVLGALAIPAAGLWWAASHVAFANDQAKEQKTMAEAVSLLTEIRVYEKTKGETEMAMVRKLCAAGKLKGADCVSPR